MATTRKPVDLPTPAKAMRMRVWYEDGSFSAVFNPNKPALLTVFEAEHGYEAPQSVPDMMWLAWHALGRPGESAEAWALTVEDLERFELELGKAYR